MTPSKSNNDTELSVELKKLNTTFNKEDIHSFSINKSGTQISR